jgi:hypothetical protein
MGKRMISTGLPDSEKMMDCSNDTVRLLFVWLCLSVDDDGRMQGRPRTIKKRFFGDRDNITVKKCEEMLGELSRVGLIFCYKEKDSESVFIEIPKWGCINKVRKDMYKPSEILPFSEDVHEPLHDRNVPVTSSLHRLDKVRLDKDRLDKSREGKEAYSKNVYLTLKEYVALLNNKFGGKKKKLEAGIEKLDAYKESNGKTYVSDFGAMRSWVAKEIMDEKKVIIERKGEYV